MFDFDGDGVVDGFEPRESGRHGSQSSGSYALEEGLCSNGASRERKEVDENADCNQR